MWKAVTTSARLLSEERQQGGFRGYMAMIRLSYAGGAEVPWSPRDVAAFMACVRKWFARRGLALGYVWVAELGALHGRLHYHVLVWVPRGYTLPKPDKRGWWPHGSTRIERARSAGYVVKYATKGVEGSHEFPKGARIHGAGGLTAAARVERRWWMLPAYVREAWGIADRPRRAAGGGFFAEASGEWMPSRYVLSGFGPGGVVYLVERCRAGLPPQGAARPAPSASA